MQTQVKCCVFDSSDQARQSADASPLIPVHAMQGEFPQQQIRAIAEAVASLAGTYAWWNAVSSRMRDATTLTRHPGSNRRLEAWLPGELARFDVCEAFHPCLLSGTAYLMAATYTATFKQMALVQHAWARDDAVRQECIQAQSSRGNTRTSQGSSSSPLLERANPGLCATTCRDKDGILGIFVNMGVKWTPEQDQIILETSDVRVDSKAIAERWPKEKGFSPTPRAIQERLVKIRQIAQAQFSISSYKTKTDDKSSLPATPRARGPRAKGSSSKSASKVTPSKRKRVEDVSDDSEHPSSFKEDGNDSDASDDIPIKRSKITVQKEPHADRLDNGSANDFATAEENGVRVQEGMWAEEV
ncbi:MAG: hypothetical protein LQ351_005237 [Letrouitia transgressa]|nr:MAG: hypothetical protein LQ351_005237 [Letrouitia transgressa]